ncbi:MAG: type I restriction enzyme HsdR N-terminal domain-containing protein [Bacteroidia bacterium]|nr:type I restriction enzyme HsdR N-terminal domain-containing protein [Bacteroidia bacterium]
MSRLPDQIWDSLRRRLVPATPEEDIRQRFITFLLERGYPQGAIQVEFSTGQGRFDIAVNAPDGSLWLLVECKAAATTISSLEKQAMQALSQLRRYRKHLPFVHHFSVVLGERVWCWRLEDGESLSDIPAYPA